ncbi:S1 RNA-binding domain-containing protein [Candidatus Dojkabacteria bacterium]|uniref:S1 RNA-binding domain-containing protein n=1 Tax=Candidatus Dojkabacteria bacterium TaxID=2099670 RepID=A0A955RKM2_9BACT|nr:S1 RNA-binding domain-containing protein [Candidatus Dojkabacteria bacterium]
MSQTNTKLQSEFEKYLNELAEPPKTFQRGQIVKGIIKHLGKGEMIVDVGGRAEGVVLGKELKLDGETLDKKEGDTVLLYVIKGENELGQIELSIRRSGTARKWYDLETAQEDDKSINVTVIEANTGGVIVSIGGGLRGFIPTSQLDNGRIYPLGGYGDKQNAKKELQNKLGDLIDEEIEVKVIEIDKQKNRVILSEKLVTSSEDLEMREETLKETEVGDNLEGKVTGIAPFGLFVNAQGLEGLVHLSEISWDKVSNPADFYKVGDDVTVQVIGMQDDGKRIAYSIKRLIKDPWDEIIEQYKVGQVVKGEITKVVDYGAFVRIDDKVNGLIHISEMSDNLVKDPNDFVSVGDTVELSIISISREERHLGLSMKRVGQEEEEKKTSSKSEEKSEGAIAPEMAALSELLEE